MNEDLNHRGKRLNDERLRLGMGVDALATILGLRTQKIEAIISNDSSINLHDLKKLESCGYDILYILWGDYRSKCSPLCNLSNYDVDQPKKELSIGQRIFNEVNRLGYTSYEIAEYLRIKTGFFSNYDNLNTVFSLEHLDQLEDCGFDLIYILFGDEGKKYAQL